MRIYIHTDLEGVSGITEPGQVKLGREPQPEATARRLMADVNAAVDGAFAGGATFVTVVDEHRGGGNFIMEQLDPRADYDAKENGEWYGKLDDSYDGAFVVGAHAMLGVPRAFLCHAFSGEFYKYMVNGREMGELGMFAMVAGHFGVPVIMVSGDDAACREAANFFDPVTTAPVKKSVSVVKAVSLPDKEAENLIRQAAKDAMSLIGSARPFRPTLPMEIKIEYVMTWGKNPAERAAKRPGAERIDGRTVRRLSDNYLDIFI